MTTIYIGLVATLFTIIETTKEFTTRSVKSAEKNQQAAIAQLKIVSSFEEQEKENEEHMMKMYEDIITWETTNHFFVVFGKEGGFGVIYKNPETIDLDLQKLIISQKEIEKSKGGNPSNIVHLLKSDRRAENLTNYANLSHDNLANEILNIFDIHERKDRKCGENSGYILTPDNFLKMVLIYFRVRAQIPIILMGETGVGKTALVQFLVKSILMETLEKITLHAGITSDYIIQTINKLQENLQGTPDNHKVWVFFDEFNTTNSIGLIKEIICDRTMLGNPLSDKLIFVAACNPFRLKNAKACFNKNIGIIHKHKTLSTYKSYKLLYTVHPIPDTMLNYIWDFGYLNQKDEEKQISAIMKSSLQIPQNCREYFCKPIFEAQQFLKEIEDVSSVSLRDVQRFRKLFEFFLNHLGKAKISQVL